MKLELKHLAPYLPFRLEIQVAGENIDDDPEGLPRIFTMVGIVDGEVIRSKKGYISNVEEGIEDVFPILKPLSYFKEKFIRDVKIELELSHNQVMEFFGFMDGDIKLDNITLGLYNAMCENHIDFKRLIEKGLAIDINTLKK